MFDLVLPIWYCSVPLQLFLQFLIYHLQPFKPVPQILFAQIMDQDVDQVLFAGALAFSVWRFASARQASLFQQFLDIDELVRNFTIRIFYDLFRHNYIGHCQFEQEKKKMSKFIKLLVNSEAFARTRKASYSLFREPCTRIPDNSPCPDGTHHSSSLPHNLNSKKRMKIA